MPSQSSEEYQILFNLVEMRTGLSLEQRRREDVMVVLADLSESKLSTPQLVQILHQQPITHPWWQEIINVITVGETYFFRNEDQFRMLRENILPEMIAQKRTQGIKQLRLWSAGCATGEEPYSLAILLRELIPDIDQWNIHLLATDLNTHSLNYARQGVYRARSFRSETPADLRDRWFRAEPGGGHKLDAAARQLVTFAPLNLISDEYPSFFNGTTLMDMIVCRNVTIYFDAETTRGIVNRFHKSLSAGAWLMVGHSEPMTQTYREFTPRNFPNAIFYQKAEEVVPDWSLPPAVPSPLQPALQVASQNDVLARLKASTAAVKPAVFTLPGTAAKPVKAAALTPEGAWAQARTAANVGQWDVALAALGVAEQADVLQPQVHYLRSLIELQQDDIDGAFLSLRRAIYCDPSFAIAHYTLGDLYEKIGDQKSAQRHWRLARTHTLNLDPRAPLPFADDMTIEMFRGLLTTKLGA